MAPGNVGRPLNGRDRGHTCGDAYMHVPYRCRTCGGVEWVWNSRDGVTPFLIDCRACAGTAAHTNWRMDEYRRDYRPQVGERIFVDTTEEDSLQAAEAAFQRGKGTPYEVPENLHADWVRRAAADMPQGDPKLIVVIASRQERRRAAKEGVK